MRRNFSAKLVDLAGNSVAGLSLAILITLLILWTRSLHGTDTLEIPGPGDSSLAFTSAEGRFMFGLFEADRPTVRWWGRQRHASLSDLVSDDTYFTADLWGWGVAVPYFLLVAITLVPIAWWFFVFRERREKSRWAADGHCMECGYDLRYATDRCPECGTPCGLQPAGSVEHAST